jgi:hypothetical protein
MSHRQRIRLRVNLGPGNAYNRRKLLHRHADELPQLALGAVTERCDGAVHRQEAVELARDSAANVRRQPQFERVAVRDEDGVLSLLALFEDGHLVARAGGPVTTSASARTHEA